MGTSGWGETEGVKPTVVLCRSVGWLVHDAKDCKLIVPHLSDSDHANVKEQGCGDMTIPASAVRKVVRLKVPRKS